MNKLKSKRLEFGLKQNALANRLGISTRHYQRYENEGRKLSCKQLNIIAKIFNCNVAEIRQNKEE